MTRSGVGIAGAAALLILALGTLYVDSILSTTQVYRALVAIAGSLFLVPAALLIYEEIWLPPARRKESESHWDAVLGLAIVIIVLSFGLLSGSQSRAMSPG